MTQSVAMINNKFRNKAADAYYDELEKQLRTPVDTPDNDTPPTPPAAPAVVDWEKRYKDLQSYHSQKENDWKAKEAEKDRLLNELKNSSALPTGMTDEEIAEWERKFPAVAKVIDYKAQKKAEVIAGTLQERINSMEQTAKKVEQREAYAKLLSLHNDWDTLKDTPEFNSWLDEQDAAMQDAINNPTDYTEASVNRAARVIRFYKLEKGTPQPDKPRKTDPSDAELVTRSRSESPDDFDQTPRFTESQIAKMSSKEFEKNMPAILEAQRKGPPYFVYDVSTATRV